ncbi:MAG: hypothetical protein ACE5GX_07805 [Thermoanaerobaculia bacterium]
MTENQPHRKRATLGWLAILVLWVASPGHLARAGTLEVLGDAASLGSFGLRVTIGATCAIPDVVVLGPTVNTDQLACNTITAGNVQVVGPGSTFTARNSIALFWLVDGTALFGTRFPDFEERDWLLIADFANRTGEESLDGTLEAALRRELVSSGFVNVAPRARLEDTLLLMGKSTETRIDAELGREVALRDGGIRAVLVGRVEKVGPSYLLSVDLQNPADGATVECLSEEAHGQAELLPAISSVSVQVREILGEALPRIRAGPTELDKVSTPSFRALELYSRADRLFTEENLGGPDRNQAAESLRLSQCFLSAGIHRPPGHR